MQEFFVEWRIEIYAESYEEAAAKAQEIQRRPGTTANVFHVTDEYGDEVVVDLDEVD